MIAALVGLPAAGKRTMFSLLTGRIVEVGVNEVIEGVALIRDSRVDRISAIVHPKRTTYAENHFLLCPDVCEGVKAKNWIDAIRRADLICVVVRGFTASDVYHPAGSVDAERDRAMVENELLLADMERVEMRLDRLSKEKRAGQTAQQKLEEHVLGRFRDAMEDGRRLSAVVLDENEEDVVRSLGLLTRKPLLFVYNVDEGALALNDGLLKLSCRIEQEIMGLENPEERRDYLATLGVVDAGVDRMNAAVYDALGLMSFYTMGKDEVRAWTIRKGTLAPRAAGKIHTDIERGFIRAQVIKFDDLMELGSEEAVKQQGKVALRGKDYAMEDGDIVEFRFNV